MIKVGQIRLTESAVSSHYFPIPEILRVPAAEGGYFPGILLYLTYWFRQREQAQAVALFITGIPVANILGAPLSGLILDHMHAFGLGSWRWLLNPSRKRIAYS